MLATPLVQRIAHIPLALAAHFPYLVDASLFCHHCYPAYLSETKAGSLIFNPINPFEVSCVSPKVRNLRLRVDTFPGTSPTTSESFQYFPLLPANEKVVSRIGVWLHIVLGDLVLQR